MVCLVTSIALCILLSSQLSLASGVLDLRDAHVETFGIVRGRDFDGKEVFAKDDAQAEMAPEAQFAAANSSQGLVGRNSDLVERQTCSAGYGYCSGEFFQNFRA